MPRPPDHYTHSQFQPIDSDFRGETVRCVHCKQWTGSDRTLSRKKEHLLKCNAYAAWRAAGNGQDLAPPNKYAKRDSSALNDAEPYSSPYGDVNYGGPQYPPTMARSKIQDVSRFFHEFWDGDAAQKCMRARCISCGAARAKNTTRQVEHLQQCPQFLNSADGQDAISDGLLTERPIEASANTNGTRDIWKGGAPNPNLSTNRTKPRHSGGRPTITPNRPAASKSPAPSLVNYLLAKNYAAVDVATEQPFLSHAGCGTLSTAALEQWLTQQGHMSREFTIFIGSVIGKIRLTNTDNPQGDTAWRTLDLLVSTLNNAKRELEFLRTTQYKYGLQSDSEPPKPVTKGLIDLFKSAASPTSSLLESMVVVWAVEHLYNVSWQYAAKLIQADQPPSTNYSVPEYVGVSMYGVHASQPQSLKKYDETHTAALHEALIPNWTSLGFSKFVDACKAIVDELANNETSGNGAGELGRYDVTFRQVVWLWKQSWPEVTGMGEEDEDAEMGEEGQSQAGGNAENDGPIEIQDDDDAGRDEDAPTADSPYGGTGLGAVAAANRGP